MAERNRSLQSTDDRTILLKSLRDNQDRHPEGSKEWLSYQQQINQIIAENYSSYVTGVSMIPT